MKKCRECQSCNHQSPVGVGPGGGFAIVGNMNVGKATLFSRLLGAEAPDVTMPGTSVAIRSGYIRNTNRRIYDTPGIYSIFSSNEDERATRDILLLPKNKVDIQGIILVADAKNLKRSLAVALQFAEYGLPMLLDVNMIDEAASRGIEIDYRKLAAMLGIEVCTTVARVGIGVNELIAGLNKSCPPTIQVEYPVWIEQYLELVHTLLGKGAAVSPRALGLLLLNEDKGVEGYIAHEFGDGMLAQMKQLAENYRQEGPAAVENILANLYQNVAARIADEVQETEPPSRSPLLLRFGDWCTSLSTGIPIAIVILTVMYLFVGSFAATFLVDTINGLIFGKFLMPLADKLVAPIPSAFIRDMIMDPDFGLLPTGVFLALGLVLPVLFCFYIAFGTLEDSGYLPRLSVMLDKVFQKMGLNGKAVIPLMMGFSCVTMAILTTRVLSTEKERNIASFLLFLGMPCAPLIAVMFIILNKMPFSATLTVFGLLFCQILVAGFLLNRVLPGKRSPLLLEIPPMRRPRVRQVVRMAAAKTYFFMKEAIPVFLFASLVVFLFQRIGGLDLLEKTLGPVIKNIMGLPEKSVQVFIKTMIRRESGAAELEHLSGVYSNLQLVVNLLVMTYISPCLNSIMVLFKERGRRTGTVIMGTVIVYAVLAGSIISHACRFFGITFS